MTPLTSFLPEVLPFCPALPTPAALSAILNSAIELCQDARLWRVSDDPLALQAGVGAYDLSPPAGLLVDVVSCALNRPPNSAPDVVFGPGATNGPFGVLPASPAEMDALDANWRTTQGAVPLRYCMETKGTLQVWPVPQDAITPGLLLTYAVKPSRADTSLPDFLYEDWLDVIAAGALSRLLLLPDTPWFNGALAQVKLQQFQKGKRTAALHAARGNTRAEQGVKPRLFGFY